jgi:hypothetical protein
MDATTFHQVLVDVHGNYRAKRLAHERPDELISDVVTARTLQPHLVRSGFLFSMFWFVLVLMLITWVLALLVSVPSGARDPFEENPAEPLVAFGYFLLTVLVFITIGWLISLFVPVAEPIAEYGLLIEGRAAAHARSYWWIMNTIRGRQSPFHPRLGRAGGHPILLLAAGRQHAMVIVRPVGTDLYVGWTMWRSRSAAVLIAHIFRDMFSSPLAAEVRASSARALRELVHSVTREGVQAAILQPPVTDEQVQAEVGQLAEFDALTFGQLNHLMSAPAPTPAPGFDQQTGFAAAPPYGPAPTPPPPTPPPPTQTPPGPAASAPTTPPHGYPVPPGGESPAP